MPDLTIGLDDNELESLAELSDIERRPIEMQAALIIRRELEHCELIKFPVSRRRKKVENLIDDINSAQDELRATRDLLHEAENKVKEITKEIEGLLNQATESVQGVHNQAANYNSIVNRLSSELMRVKDQIDQLKAQKVIMEAKKMGLVVDEEKNNERVTA